MVESKNNKNKNLIISGFAHFLLIGVIVIVAIALYAPTPYFETGSSANCMLINSCPEPGLNWKPSLFRQMVQKTQPSIQDPEQTSMTPQENVNLIPDQWETYPNEEYGFTFRHPSNAKLFVEQDSAIVIISIDESVIPLTISTPRDNPDMHTSKDFVIDEYAIRKRLESEGKTFGPVVMPEDVGPISIGGQQSFQGTIPSFDHEKLLIYTPYKDKMFVFDYPYEDPNTPRSKLEEAQKIYTRILSTFLFTN